MQSILDSCKGLPTEIVPVGRALLTEGDKTGRLYFLIDGKLEILKGKYQVNTVAEPGAIFGEISVLLDLPHMATVRALTESRVYVVDDASGFLQSHSEINYHLSKMLAQRLQGVTSYLVDLKRQFEDQESHLGMVDEVLETLVNQQPEEFTPGSKRDPNTEI